LYKKEGYEDKNVQMEVEERKREYKGVI